MCSCKNLYFIKSEIPFVFTMARASAYFISTRHETSAGHPSGGATSLKFCKIILFHENVQWGSLKRFDMTRQDMIRHDTILETRA